MRAPELFRRRSAPCQLPDPLAFSSTLHTTPRFPYQLITHGLLWYVTRIHRHIPGISASVVDMRNSRQSKAIARLCYVHDSHRVSESFHHGPAPMKNSFIDFSCSIMVASRLPSSVWIWMRLTRALLCWACQKDFSDQCLSGDLIQEAIER